MTPPAFKTYLKELNKRQLDLTIETAQGLASDYKNCVYLNLIKDTSFEAKDFYDADHLNEIGAKKLSLIVNNLILNRDGVQIHNR